MPSRDSAIAIMWDMDGTLHNDYSQKMDFAYESAGAQAAIDCGVPLSFDEAKQFAHDAYENGQSYLDAFKATYGIDGHEFHFRYHAHIDHRCICVSEGLRDQFQRLGVSNNVIVTHGARDWAERVVSHLGLEEFFPSDRIVAFEDGAFCKKSESPKLFELGMEILNVPADCILVVEDKATNLRIPFGMGMKTLHIDYGKPLTPRPDYVSLRAATVSEALDTLTRIGNKNWAGLFSNPSTRAAIAFEL